MKNFLAVDSIPGRIIYMGLINESASGFKAKTVTYRPSNRRKRCVAHNPIEWQATPPSILERSLRLINYSLVAQILNRHHPGVFLASENLL